MTDADTQQDPPAADQQQPPVTDPPPSDQAQPPVAPDPPPPDPPLTKAPEVEKPKRPEGTLANVLRFIAGDQHQPELEPEGFDPDKLREQLQRLAELLDQDSCLAKLATLPLGTAEPIFVLRGQDKVASEAVRFWATKVRQRAENTQDDDLHEKAAGAFARASAMEAWEPRRFPD